MAVAKTRSGGLSEFRDNGDDAKRTRILDGALKVFTAYGFSRTTMDDIARAAELSRPSLYLVFRNKTDIYRAIARCLLMEIVDRAQQALTGEGTLLARMDRMIQHAFYDLLNSIEESPHGPELMDIRNTLAADLFQDWRCRMLALLEAAIDREVRETSADLAARELSPRVVAETFLDALEGMKPRITDPQLHLSAARSNARVLVAALRP